MVGDRLNTDMLMAQDSKCLSVLVLSGMTSRLEADRSQIKPSLIIDNLGKLDAAVNLGLGLQKAG